MSSLDASSISFLSISMDLALGKIIFDKNDEHDDRKKYSENDQKKKQLRCIEFDAFR